MSSDSISDPTDAHALARPQRLTRVHEVSQQLCNRCCTTRAIISGVPRPRTTWVLLAYRLPREPSTPRSALWRKLRRLGAAQVLDGLAALPLDARNREQLEWLADEVSEAGGEATIWIGELASARQERELATRMAEAVADDYAAVIAEAAAAGADATGQRRRTLARLRRELRRTRARDYFPPPERERAERAVEELATLVEETVA
jgi:Protein ChrB, N-terminal